MLFDPNWNKTNPDVMSVEALAAWLETMPADEAYYYGDIRNCLICQYLRYCGIKCSTVGGSCYRASRGDPAKPLPLQFNWIAVHGQRTFGAALSRARSITGV